jgi:hypothetical protein
MTSCKFPKWYMAFNVNERINWKGLCKSSDWFEYTELYELLKNSARYE